MDINLEIDAIGNLTMTADYDTRLEIAETLEARGYWSTLWEIFEPYACNGSYQPFDAGDGNPFVGLTSAPCVAECIDTHDDGTREIIGALWTSPSHMTECEIMTLIETGRFTWTLVTSDAQPME